MNTDPLQKPPYQEVEGRYVFAEWLNKLWEYLKSKFKEQDNTNAYLATPPEPSTGQEGWADLLCTIEARGTGLGKPTYTALPGVLSYADAYQFAAGDKVTFYVHLPHDYKWGTPIYFHCHWLANTTSTNTVTWRFQYSYARGYGVEAFGAGTTVDVTQAGSGTALTHMIAEPAEGSGLTITNAEPDGLLICTLTLQTNNLGVNPYCMFADLHYYSDGTLTRERNRTFTKHRD